MEEEGSILMETVLPTCVSCLTARSFCRRTKTDKVFRSVVSRQLYKLHKQLNTGSRNCHTSAVFCHAVLHEQQHTAIIIIIITFTGKATRNSNRSRDLLLDKLTNELYKKTKIYIYILLPQLQITRDCFPRNVIISETEVRIWSGGKGGTQQKVTRLLLNHQIRPLIDIFITVENKRATKQ